jgi:exopolysaccharide biosynthesis polyprenyl glycosylphosphotransferase
VTAMTTVPAAATAVPVADAPAERATSLVLAPAPSRRARTFGVPLSRPGLAAADVLLAVAVVVVAGGILEVPGTSVAGVLVLLWLVCLAAGGTFDLRLDLGVAERVRRVLRAGACLGLVCWLLPLATGDDTPTSTFLVLAVTLIASGALTHVVAPAVAARLGTRTHRMVVTGDAAQVEHAVRELGRLPRPPAVTTVVLDGRPEHDTVRDVSSTVADLGADGVVALPGPGLPAADLRRLGWELERSGAQLYVGTELVDVSRRRTSTTSLGGMRVVHVRTAPAGLAARLVKAVVERALAATALILLLPGLVAISIAVRATSSGPAIFRQTRVGRNGREFTMYKFRTMTVDAERSKGDLVDRNECEVLFKIRQDPRITRLGAVLRRYSIDEVPQLLNVVLGSMSLVGPRPALPAEVAQYAPDEQRRLVAPPGITGLWQVSGRSDLTWDEAIRLDLEYVDNWSLGLDLALLVRTVGAVAGHRGAY